MRFCFYDFHIDIKYFLMGCYCCYSKLNVVVKKIKKYLLNYDSFYPVDYLEPEGNQITRSK
jgi:hypothetical protein